MISSISPTFLFRRLIFVFGMLPWISSVQAGYAEGRLAEAKGDYAAAIAEWEPLVEKRHPKALIELGKLYARGLGVEKNLDKARRLFLAGTEAGADGAYSLLSQYAPRNERLEWLRRGANAGEARSQLSLAQSYIWGSGGVQKNLKKAFYWELRAANNGFHRAQGNVGVRYWKGHGTKKDPVLGYMWSLIAANSSGIRSRMRRLETLRSSRAKMTSIQIASAVTMANEWLQENQIQTPMKLGQGKRRFETEKITANQISQHVGEIFAIDYTSVHLGRTGNFIDIPGQPVLVYRTKPRHIAHPSLIIWQDVSQPQSSKPDVRVHKYYASNRSAFYEWWDKEKDLRTRILKAFDRSELKIK